MIKIYNMDCMVLLANAKNKAYDLAIVDPPYGIGENGSKNKSRGKYAIAKDYKAFWGNDSASPNLEYFKELLRVSKNQIIFGANHFISKIPFDSACWVVWNKNNGQTDFADCELAWTSFKSAVRIFEYKWQGMLQNDMRNKEIRIHPTQKPVALYRWLLEKYAKQGDKILDTHLGSGSIAIACHDLGFDLDACELDKDYFLAAKDRLEQHQRQLRLF